MEKFDERWVVSTTLLQPGDVILTYGSKSSFRDHVEVGAIGYGSVGSSDKHDAWSHASLVVSSNLLYESDGANPIGLKHVEGAGAYEEDGCIRLIGFMPGEPQRCAVLRHPEIGRYTENDITQALQLLYLETQGKDYPALVNLVRFCRFDCDLVKRAIRKVLIREDRKSRRKLLPGAFCSEVVGRFFECLGLQLTEPVLKSSDTTPNHLASEACLLRRQTGLAMEYGSVKRKLLPEMAGDQKNTLTYLNEATAKSISDTNQMARIAQMLAAAKAMVEDIQQWQAVARFEQKLEELDRQGASDVDA